eukprot:7409639-Pyramimonas_sp.AAC.1
MSQKEWQEWSASGERPHDIPSNPYATYRNEGWLSWADWLGYGKERRRWRGLVVLTEFRGFLVSHTAPR